MSQARVQDPSHNPLKSSFPSKPRRFFFLLARIPVIVCLIASICFVLYSAFSNHSRGNHIFLPRLKSESTPDREPTNISHILFSISGSAATWHDRTRYINLWWKPNRTRGFVWLDEEPRGKNGASGTIANTIPYRVSDPGWTRFRYSSSRSAVRIARIIWDSFKLNLPNVRWFVMGDDDTVFFTDNLLSVLTRYDHNQMWYIGCNSESVEQNVMHAYDMAFGGGGFAVSYPLAEKLVNALDGCLERYYYFYGSDQRIWACISEIGVSLTPERGFHQVLTFCFQFDLFLFCHVACYLNLDLVAFCIRATCLFVRLFLNLWITVVDLGQFFSFLALSRFGSYISIWTRKPCGMSSRSEFEI